MTFEFFADSFQIGYRVQVINRSQEAKSLRIRHVFGEGRVQNDDYQQQGAHTGPVYFVEESVETETNSDVQQEFQVANADWFGVEDQFFLNAVELNHQSVSPTSDLPLLWSINGLCCARTLGHAYP